MGQKLNSQTAGSADDHTPRFLVRNFVSIKGRLRDGKNTFMFQKTISPQPGIKVASSHEGFHQHSAQAQYTI